MTRSAPARSASRTAGSERRPPPYWTGTASWWAICSRWSSDLGLPVRAPSRSTTCRKRAPASTHARAASSGESRYTVFSAKSPLTRRTAWPSEMSIAGWRITGRWRSDRRGPRADRGEVAQQREAVRRGLLGVELHAVDRVARHDRDERPAVVAAPEHVGGLGRPGHERVHVVEGAAVRQPLGERRGARHRHDVPPDVRDLQRRRLGMQVDDLAGQQPQARVAAKIDRALEQELHPQAQPDHRRPGAHALHDELVEAERAQALHRRRERADPGHDQPVGGHERVVVAGQHDAGADPFERLLDAAAVAHAVVDDPDRRRARAHAVSVPFVDGTPASVGSIATAARSARANALKAASIMWWAFVPASTVRWRVSRALLDTARKNSSVSSWSKPPVTPGGRTAASKARYGRPEMSIEHAARASSIGTTEWP